MANAAIRLRSMLIEAFEGNMGCTINATTMPLACQRPSASPACALHFGCAMVSFSPTSLRLRALILRLGALTALLAGGLLAACSVPEVHVGTPDGSTAGDDGSTGADVTTSDQLASDGGGDDGGSADAGDAAGDAPSDAPFTNTCPDATPSNFNGCCGTTPCIGNCTTAACGGCTNKCNVGDQCCVHGGTGSCHAMGTGC
jgi:hypothetical protein